MATTRNRGKKSNDDQLFSGKWLPIFREATDDFCHLLSRGYAGNSITQIVGNRYKLNARQRLAIQRISASSQQIESRQKSQCDPEALEHAPIEIDGFNLLILLESAMSGAYIFEGRDGTFRDISSVHGSYKRVRKTEEAIFLVGNILKDFKAGSVKWFFDQPVSNSGRLKTMLLEISKQNNYKWEVELVHNPDKELIKNNGIVISSDSWVLDHAEKWYNLGACLIKNHLKESNIISV